MLKDSYRESMRNLRRRPLQSLLAILGILLGISGSLLLDSVGKGVSESVEKQINSIGPGVMSVIPKPTVNPGEKSEPLRMSDFRALKENKLDGSSLSPIIQSTENVIADTKDSFSLMVGADYMFPDIQPVTLASGRFFTSLEVENHKNVVVLGESLAKRLFDTGASIGKSVIVRNNIYEVIGIVKLDQGTQAGDTNNLFYVPYTTVLQQLTGTDEISGLLIKVSNPVLVPQVEAEILNVLQRQHSWSLPNDAFTVYKQDFLLQSASNLNSIINLFVKGAVVISYLLGGIGVMNVMLMAANERRHEIGVFLAFGARSTVIQFQFLLESVWISLIGVGGGMLFGTLLGLIAYGQGLIPWSANFFHYLYSLVGGLGVGILFGAYPSFKAAKVNPADVIRH